MPFTRQLVIKNKLTFHQHNVFFAMVENDLTKAVAYANIWAAIVPTLGLIGTLIAFYIKTKEAISLKRQNRELNDLNPNLDVLENYGVVWEKLKEILKSDFVEGNAVSIKNIGLDLEKILPDLGDLVSNASKKYGSIQFKYEGLIINPEAPLIANLINGQSNLQTEFVRASYRRLHVLENQFLNAPTITFNVVSYNIPPTFHGVMINEKHLFLGFTEIHNKKIFGSDRPYIYMKFDPQIDATLHYFTVYKNWFNHYWNNE